MAEYLDKGDMLEVINYIRTKYISVYNRKDKCSQFWADTIRYFEKQINNLAACDVVDAVYGKWVVDSDGCLPYCSECKNEPYSKKNVKILSSLRCRNGRVATMAEYINKEEILKFPIKSSIRTYHYDRERGNAHYIKGVESVVEYIENIPTVDAVEVIRCKDCQHYFKPLGRCDKHSEYPAQSISGFGFSFWVNEDDFCSHGEKYAKD